MAQPECRLHLSVLQPHSSAERGGECRAAVVAHFPVQAGAPRARHDRAAHRGTVGPLQALSAAALRWTGAARRHRSRRGHRSDGAGRGRAYRRPRRPERRGNSRPDADLQQGLRQDYRDGNPRPTGRGACAHPAPSGEGSADLLMKFAPLILKHLRKNWLRTLSTVLAMAVCIFLICTLQTVVDAVNYGLHLGNASRLVTRHYVSLVFNLPNSYKAKIAAIPGVQNTTIVNWFGGMYRDDMKFFFPNMAVEPERFLEIYPEIVLPEDQKQAWFHDGRGCIVGRKLAEKWGWKVGD